MLRAFPDQGPLSKSLQRSLDTRVDLQHLDRKHIAGFLPLALN